MYKVYWDEERETMPRTKREKIILEKIKKQESVHPIEYTWQLILVSSSVAGVH